MLATVAIIVCIYSYDFVKMSKNLLTTQFTG